MADSLSLHIAQSHENQAADHYGAKYNQHPAVRVLNFMLNEAKRPGRNKGAGFYSYPDSGPRRLWNGLAEAFPHKPLEISHSEIKDRLLFAQVIEAAWCLQEKVILSTAAANLGRERRNLCLHL